MANIYDLVDTWNDGLTTFTAIKMNVTDTASASGSLLMDLKVGASSVFEVRAKPTGSLGAAFIEVGNNERFFDLKDNFGTGFIASAGGSLHIGTGASAGNYVGGFHWSGGVCARINGFLGFASSGSLANQPDLRMTRKAAGNLRFGAADAGTSATVTITSANPGVVTWGNHGLSTGSPVKFTTTGTLPTNIVAGTVYYVIYVNANSFQLATSFANALAGTAIDTSGGSPSGTHTGYKGAVAQKLSVQSSSTLADFPGADMVIQGSQSTGSAAGGSILFQVSPAGSAGPGQNGFQTALTIDSAKDATFANDVAISGTTPSSSQTTGALVIAGGVGISGSLFCGAINAGANNIVNSGTSNYIGTIGSFFFKATADGVVELCSASLTGGGFDRLQFGGTTSSFPAIKRSTTSLQARLADDSAFTNIQGKLTTDTAYTAGAPTPAGYLVVYDSTGTAYKIPAEAL